jgi:hypothetical protein
VKIQKRQIYKKYKTHKNTKKAKHIIAKSILFRRGHGEPGFPVRKLINALNYLEK